MERYVSAAGEASLAEETERLSTGVDRGVRLLLTLYTPEEESCLHVFIAPSLAMLEHATHQAGVGLDRVSPVTNITGESVGGGNEIRTESLGLAANDGSM